MNSDAVDAATQGAATASEQDPVSEKPVDEDHRASGHLADGTPTSTKSVGPRNQAKSASKYVGEEALQLKNLTNQDFAQREYWEERFKEEEEYDWLCEYAALEPHLMHHLKGRPNTRILVIGCGNSTFSASLYDAGFHNITNIDFAPSVIERMTREHSKLRPEMAWIVMDMLAMTSFDDSAFDMVIGKGSLDALQASIKDVWDPSAESRRQADVFLREVRRVLTASGTFFSVSFEQPHFRTKFLMGKTDAFETDPYKSFKGYCPVYGWNLDFIDIGADGCLSVFIYTMQICSEPPAEPAIEGQTSSLEDRDTSGDSTQTGSAPEEPSPEEGSLVRHDIPSTPADVIHNGFPDNSDSSW